MSGIAKRREHKGNSLLIFPEDCTVIDAETTGLDARWDDILEIAALRIRGGSIVDRFCSLVNPQCEISEFITDLTGITNEDVADAPIISDILPAYLDFLGKDIIVGHNVNFDINFIYDVSMAYLEKPLSNDFVDTMRISRRVFPDLKHHRLQDMADALAIIPTGEHRSLADCETTFSVLKGLQSTAESFEIDLAPVRKYHAHTHASDIVAEPGKEDPYNPLYGKVCVFTGKLEKMLRKDAMQLVVNLGGKCADTVTTKANFLILGNNDYCPTIKDGKSTKQKRAEALILKGQDLRILSEDIFYDLVTDEGGITITGSKPLDGDAFGCCSRFVECSDAKECTNPDKTMALNCQYRQNLLAGRIFYGKNKNI